MKKILLIMLCLLIAVSGGACAVEDENLAKAKNLWGEENVILSDDGATFELTPGLISCFISILKLRIWKLLICRSFQQQKSRTGTI